MCDGCTVSVCAVRRVERCWDDPRHAVAGRLWLGRNAGAHPDARHSSAGMASEHWSGLPMSGGWRMCTCFCRSSNVQLRWVATSV